MGRGGIPSLYLHRDGEHAGDDPPESQGNPSEGHARCLRIHHNFHGVTLAILTVLLLVKWRAGSAPIATPAPIES